jgi:cytochrome c553
MNKIILLILFTISFRTSMANDIKASVILQNCNVCHTEESTKSDIIRPLKTLEKSYFLSKMYEYKKEKKNNVMNRILEPISILDIINMADYLYGE